MIAVDTNVLLRYLLDDDPLQSVRATRLFRAGRKILVTDVVLAETLWTLSGSKYRAAREDLVRVIDVLFADSTIEFENSAVVWRAFGDFRSTDADFQDALILRKAEHTATLQQASLSAFYTFDAAALQLDGAVRPA